MKEHRHLSTVKDVTLEEQNRGICSENQNSDKSIGMQCNQTENKICVFGTHLECLMSDSSHTTVPYVVSRLCKYIEEYGLYQQCLFQDMDHNCVVDGLKKEFNEFGDASLESSGNVPAASLLLKLFFEELPEPLIPISVQSNFVDEMEECINSTSDCVKNLKILVDQLPCPEFCVLKYLSHFLLRVAKHGQANGLSSANLGIIFGPILFRSNKEDPLICIMIGNITHHFVSDYYSIFEENQTFKTDIMLQLLPTLDGNFDSVSPISSAVVSEALLKPLNVFIPPADDLSLCLNDSLYTPVLLIADSSDEKNWNKKAFEKTHSNTRVKGTNFDSYHSSRRKRKDNLLIEKSALIPHNLHDVPSLQDLLASHYGPYESKQPDIQDNLPVVDTCRKNEYLLAAAVSLKKSLIESPHPPNPKRRELASEENLPALPVYNSNRWNSNMKNDSFHNNTSDENDKDLDSYFQFLNSPVVNETSTCTKALKNRTTSCPFLIDGDNNFEHDGTSLTQAWSMLFDCDEPVRAHHHSTWTKMKENKDESISVSQTHQNSSTFEAPLSPSAYRNYLSQRSSHLDSSAAPSPPIEQLYFEKRCITEDNMSVKQLTKKIHVLKKKVWHFEERYELEFGYKPSHAEKNKFTEGKKLLSDLHNARKELKALKEESQLIADSCTRPWSSTRDIHILEDTTNFLNGMAKQENAKSEHFIEESFEKALMPQFKDKKYTTEMNEHVSGQLKSEKLTKQNVQINHGSSKVTHNSNGRSVNERHRNIKCPLVKSSSFPVHSKGGFKSLQPIIEHETMDFSSIRNEMKITMGYDELLKKFRVSDLNEGDCQLNSSCRSISQLLDSKYNSSNLHELPLSELVVEQQRSMVERRRLRKILKEFESEFLKINGRKVQRDDKGPVESIYSEYKLVKARLRLLEALISKHHEHTFI